MKKLISVFLSLVFAFSFCACTAQEDQMYSKDFLDLFDTASKISAFDTSQDSFNDSFELVYSQLEDYSKLMDIYNSYSDVVSLKQVNENAYNQPVKVDERLIELVEYGKQIYNLTNGRVNIAMGSVLSIWHQYREDGIDNPSDATLPDMTLLENANQYTSIDDVIIDHDNNTISFAKPNMSLDVGAIAKGFVCEKITEFIVDNSLWTDCIISLGGNVKVIGTKQGGPFTIAVDNPNGGDYLTALKVSENDSVVTSGGYQRYYTVNGVDYCHIINPDTLMSADFVKSVTVVCKDSALADVLSTALFTMSIDDGIALVNAVNNDDSQHTVYAMWLDNENQIVYSNGFEGAFL